MTPRLNEAAELLTRYASRVAAYALAAQGTEKSEAIRKDIDAGLATIIVQSDLPSGRVTVLLDGASHANPECLLALALPEPVPPESVN